MSPIKGTWNKGQIILDCPSQWPEGCRLLVEPLPEEEVSGLTEAEWPRDPGAIATWLEWFESFEPVELTPEDESAIAAWRKEVKDYTTEKMSKRVEGLFPPCGKR